MFYKRLHQRPSGKLLITFTLAVALLIIAMPIYGTTETDLSPSTTPYSEIKIIPGVGDDGEGAGVDVTYLNDNLQPDMILMAYDAPAGQNQFRYRVGFDLDVEGRASWSDPIIVDGIGHDAAGAGVAITNLDGNPRPDMIFMANDVDVRLNTLTLTNYCRKSLVRSCCFKAIPPSKAYWKMRMWNEYELMLRIVRTSVSQI